MKLRRAHDEWYCEIAGVQYGPSRFRHLQDLFAIGRLSPDDLVKQGRNGTWQSVRSIPALMLGGEAPAASASFGPMVGSSASSVPTGEASATAAPSRRVLPSAPWTPPRWMRNLFDAAQRMIRFLGVYSYIIAAAIAWVSVNFVAVYYPKEGYAAWLALLRMAKSPVTWAVIVAIACYVGAVFVKVRGD